MPSTVEALNLPFDEAIAFFRQKANVPTKTWTDVYAAAHSRSFMVAGAASDALLSDFRTEIEKALEQGTTLADFRKGFDEIVAKHGWSYNGKRGWRTRTIFDTNLRTAYSAGRYAQQTLPSTLEAFPFWQYHHSGAIHPRKEHLAWDGQVWAANDPVWKYIYPPNGWHCGCFTTPVSGGGLSRQGKNAPDEAPDLVFRAEEVGGRTVRVPLGVDPGFEYNPGAVWLDRRAPDLASLKISPPATTPPPPPATMKPLAAERPGDTDRSLDERLGPVDNRDDGPVLVVPAESAAPGTPLPKRRRRPRKTGED